MDYYKATERMLYNYEPLKASIDIMKLELREYEYIGCRGIDYSIEKTGDTFNINKSTEDEAIKVVNKKELLINDIAKTERKIERIERGLKLLDPLEIKIIEYRYFRPHKYTWLEIELEGIIGEKSGRKKHKEAMKKLQIAFHGEKAV